MTLIDGETFSEYFASYSRTAWRLETQPVYTIPGELLDRFNAGLPRPDDFNADWHQDVQSWIQSGKSIGRVRTIRRPLTDYQRYQLAWGIPSNVAAGEDIRILDITEDDLGLPNQDFWLFDDSTVIELNFNPDGTLLNINKPDTSNIAQYLTWQDTALRHAIPFGEYARA